MKSNKLKLYELYFDSVSLRLFSYALFAKGEESSAREAVAASYVGGYKNSLEGRADYKLLLKVLTEEIIKDDMQFTLLKCAMYLRFKENLTSEEIASFLSVTKDEAVEILKEGTSLLKAYK